MIVLGIVAIVVGLLLHIGLVVTLGIILAVVGLALSLVGGLGHPVGGRAYWY